MSAVTMKQVAESVGCSVSAVSKVLNGARGSAKVGPELAGRLREAARELGYQPNTSARRLSRGLADTVGLLSPDRGRRRDPLWLTWANGLEAGLREHGKEMLLTRSPEDMPLGSHLERLFRGKRLDVVVGYWPAIARAAEELAALAIPVLTLGNTHPVEFPSAMEDCGPGLQGLATHLAALGHRDVLLTQWVGGGEISAPERQACFDECAVATGLVPHVIRIEARESADERRRGIVQSAWEQFGQWLDAGHGVPFTAVLAFNDLAAIGMMHALRERGLSVPDDVSVVGYDHLYDDLTIPRLATIDSNLFEMGRQVAQMAARISEDPSLYEGMRRLDVPVPSIYLPGETCGPARRGK